MTLLCEKPMEFSSNSGIVGAETWRRQLLQIPTLFGRLRYLASLRDEATGRYRHPALADLYGSDATNRVLRLSHYEVFRQWIGTSLEEQKSDLDQYLRTGTDPVLLRNDRSLVPPSAHDVERQLFSADLETLLDLIRFERDAARAGPASSQPQ
jgi:hypothetical protein